MSSIIFNCEFCKYKTNKKYNLNRHMTNKHIDKTIEIKEEIEEEIYKCVKYFNHHQQNCNGLNILSCSKCMFTFTSRHYKSIFI